MSYLPVIPADTPVWLWVLCAVSAVVIIGIAKSGFGGGIGVVATPLLAVAMPTTNAVGILLPVLIVADIFAVKSHRREANYALLWWMWGGALLGLAGGWLIIAWMEDEGQLETALNLIVGAICLLFVLLQLYRLTGREFHGIPTGKGGGIIAGGTAAIASTLAHAAGPIITIYLLERRELKASFVGTSVVFFFILNLAKVPVFVTEDLITVQTLITSAWLALAVPVGAALGLWMFRRVPEKPFTLIMYIAAALAATNMIYKAFA